MKDAVDAHEIIEVASLITVPTKDKRPHLEVTINGNSITGLLDSGANVTILGRDTEHIIAAIDIQRKHPLQIIRTADGSEQIATMVIDVPYTVDGQTKIVKTLIMPSVPTKLILGTDFWQAFDIRPVMCCSAELSDENPPRFDPVNVKHELTTDQQKQLNEVIALFATAPKDGILGCTDRTVHTIDTGTATPIRQRHYVVSPYVQKGINDEVDRMLAKDIIEPIENPTWINPIVAVKKSNGKYRICIDARKLNKVTVKNAYPQTNPNKILGQLRGTKYLSAIDLTDAFYQIGLDLESRKKTAFVVPSRGAFMYKRMPMGLCNSAATISELVQSIFGVELEPFAFHFIDDFIVATDTFEEHIYVLRKVAEKLRIAGLQISAEKSRFCMQKLVFLGYVIEGKGMHPDPERIRPILEYPQPKCVKDVRRLNGMAGWYRRFIKKNSAITVPITDLIRKDKEKKSFGWTAEAQEAFEKLQQALISAPILATPNYDLPFQIETDASDYGMGAVLTQVQDGEERVIAYMSAKLTAAQRKYHVTERECLAVITAIEKFRQYIEGVKFTVISDHASLQWLQNLKDPAGRLARWALRLQAYDYEIKHRKGIHMVVPDALSRAAVETIELIKIADTTDDSYIALREAIDYRPSQHVGYRIDNNIILKRVKIRCDAADDLWRIYLPADAREDALNECHDNKLAAHGGYMKTLRRLQRHYYWPGMHSDTLQYVKSCDTCKSTKQSNCNSRAPMGRYRDPQRPFNMIALDFTGPHPTSKRGKRFLLVVIDIFSKFVLLHPIRKASAEATIDFLQTHVFLKFGVPSILISDNGPQLRSKTFAEFLQKYNVDHWKTAFYHPQANATEAANKTIMNAVRAYIADKSSHRDWDLHLPELNCALNTATHSQTKYPPYTVVFGFNMCTNGKQHHPVELSEAESDPSKMLQHIREKVARNLRLAYENAKRIYDRRSAIIQYYPNELVWKKNHVLSNAGNHFSSKFDKKWIKCRVKARAGTNTYILTDLQGNELGTYSTQFLQPA